MAGCHPFPPLLRLPRELRDEIYSYLINARTEPPLNPSFPGERIWKDEIAHPKHYCSWRYPALVWTCRQIRHECFDLMEECSRRRQVKAELDIMSKGYVFYPTWTYLPPDLPGEAPFDLEVNLRIFSTEAYRSNDGWPRQPGSGFRSLLRLLNQLVHHGPSFGHHLELLRGRWLFAIDTLSVNISFHDNCTPATCSETSCTIFRMLKALATHGLARGVVERVHAHAEYDCCGKKKTHDSTWDVVTGFNPDRANEWRDMGFLAYHQTSLSDDYRPQPVEGDYI